MNFKGFTINVEFSDSTDLIDEKLKNLCSLIEQKIRRLIFDCEYLPTKGVLFCNIEDFDCIEIVDVGFVGNDEILFWIKFVE